MSRQPLYRISSREKLGYALAQVRTLLGKPAGFFIRYDHVEGAASNTAAYDEVLTICESSNFREFLAAIGTHISSFQQFGSMSNDPDWDSKMFSPLDGAAAYTAVKQFKPQRIVEIGSGDSTRFLAKAAGATAEIICIDPQPRRSIAELPVKLEQRPLSADDVTGCDALGENDILFVDGSHVGLPGTDVDIVLNRMFPRLKSGVVVHLHDIFLPFGYPDGWSERNWSEQTALVGWLFGPFEILFPGHYVVRRHPDLVLKTFSKFAPCQALSAGSMWLRKR